MANYMVVYIDVGTGDISEVYGAQDIPINLNNVVLEEAELAYSAGEHKKFTIKDFKSDKAFMTFYAESSPGCRYIHKASCEYVKVCK
ncbi:MAG: hypothetical protein U9N83_04935 [Thermodesulfobacteriota bacterium]|nr:hypothetical protein [Thermodesulfobacteriota bacterium]